MSTIALAVATILYLLAAIDYGAHNQWGLSLAFFCYAGANIGFIIAGARG